MSRESNQYDDSFRYYQPFAVHASSVNVVQLYGSVIIACARAKRLLALYFGYRFVPSPYYHAVAVAMSPNFIVNFPLSIPPSYRSVDLKLADFHVSAGCSSLEVASLLSTPQRQPANS